MPDARPDAADLFAGFDAADVAAIYANAIEAQKPDGRARAERARHRLEVRRANSEAHLAEVLPATVAAGDSWHVISRGDIDSLSYLAHWLRAGPFDLVALSTWCMAADDVARLRGWLDCGAIDQLELYVGEIFPSQYGDEYAECLRLVDTFGARVVVARNHSKVTLAANYAADYYLAMESSANVNTNPRIEQTATHASRALFDFYLDFYRGLRSIDRRP